MASLAMLVGGAVVNALAFSGSNFLFSSMRGSDEERKRHDLAVEKLNEAHEAWTKRRTQRLDWENTQQLLQKRAQDDYIGGSMAAKAAFIATEPPLPGSEPILTDYYTPSQDQKDREIAFIAIGLTAVGAAAILIFD